MNHQSGDRRRVVDCEQQFLDNLLALTAFFFTCKHTFILHTLFRSFIEQYVLCRCDIRSECPCFLMSVFIFRLRFPPAFPPFLCAGIEALRSEQESISVDVYSPLRCCRRQQHGVVTVMDISYQPINTHVFMPRNMIIFHVLPTARVSK